MCYQALDYGNITASSALPQVMVAVTRRFLFRAHVRAYRATLHLNLGSEGGQREVQHGDELVILAAITLLKLCKLFVEGPAASGSGDRFMLPLF